MDEREPAGTAPLDELIEAVLQGAATDGQTRELDARLLASEADRRDYLHRLNLHAALRRQFAYDVEGETSEPLSAPRGLATRSARWMWAAAAGVLVALAIGAYALRPKDGSAIATVTEVHGGMQWTGNGGQVVRDLEAGRTLSGGTLESRSADSWARLTFPDGSAVTVSGQSMLTIARDRQKELHLHAGSVSCRVAPQPQGRPMLVHTPTAKLEILGTQLNVDADPASTMLRVNEGRVRVTRLADGSVADVPADHQVVLSASRSADLKVDPRPASVHAWRSGLPAGALYGTWSPEAESGGRLRTSPILLNYQKKPVALHLMAIAVSRCPAPPVVLVPGGRFRILGRLETTGDLYFSLTTRHVKGGFAGKYVAMHRFDHRREAGGRLDLELPIEAFRPQEKEFPDSPLGQELVDWCCFTYNVDTGLGLAAVELLPPAGPEAALQPIPEPPLLPLMDIWTAASHGNLEAVRRHIDAGAEINATFVAPGVPGSGVTPLHLAVLADQGEIVRFLIGKRADLDARARDEHGGAPLHWAAALGRVAIAGQLIDAGAEINARDSHGFTPLDATGYQPETAQEAKREIARLLGERGGRHAKELGKD